MSPDEVPHEYVMAAMKAAGLLHHDTARPALAAVLPMHRDAVLTEGFTPAEVAMLRFALNEAQEIVWSRDGFTDEDQAALDSLRRLADATTPTSKEQQR